MVAIPQLSRNKLASSVVGTPGVDNSGAIIADAFSDVTRDISRVGFNEAQQVQNSLDAAEAHRLSANYKMAAADLYENHKETYAADPLDKSSKLDQALSTGLENTLNQASNPRVKQLANAMLQSERGAYLAQEPVWAHNRKVNLEEAGIFETTNELARRGNTIGSDVNMPYEEKVKKISDLFNSAGDVLESARNLRFRPEKMAELEKKIPKSILTGAVYGMIDDNPAQAVDFLEHESVKKIFDQDELKKFKNDAIDSLQKFDKTKQWKQTATAMVQAPDLTNGVLDGSVKWSDLNQMPSTPLIDTLKEIALNRSPDAQAEVALEKAKLIDNFNTLAIDHKSHEAGASATAVIAFSHQLAEAYKNRVINRETFDSYNKELASPLVSAILANHDPNMFEQVGKFFQHPIISMKSFINPNAQDKLNQYQQGFKEVDSFLKHIGKDQDVSLRSAYYDRFLKVASKADFKAMDSQGRPFTPSRIARSILGIDETQMVDTPIGRRKIIGYAGPGNPILDTSEEEDQMMLLPIINKRFKKK